LRGNVDEDDRRGRWRRQVDRFLLVAAAVLSVVAAALVVALLVSSDEDGRTASPVTSAWSSPATSAAVASAPPPPSAAPPSTATTTVPSTSATSTTIPVAPAPSQPPTTVAATLTPMPTTASVVPPPADVGITAGEVETFVRSYYDAVALGEYPRSWSQLTPEFQRGKARSYEYYVDFWDANDIDVGTVEVVDIKPELVIVEAELRWNGDSDAVTDRFELRPGPDGQLLIARQDTVAN
jgi:hypothetical protein